MGAANGIQTSGGEDQMPQIHRAATVSAWALALMTAAALDAFAQLQPPEIRGLRGAPFQSMNPPPDVRSFGEGPAWDGKAPDGIQPLPLDLFTSKDFYKDKALWSDIRYWRCNSPRQVADMRSGGAGSATNDPRIGAKPPVSARWGDCKMDWPRANIASPYRFKTAKEHYEALLADAKTRGGPTRHTYETMPKWDGVYGEYAPQGRRVWNYSRANQVPTLLSLLTPKHQQRMVRQLYHEGVNAAHQWSASYCWPEGFMRQWATGPQAEPRHRHAGSRDADGQRQQQHVARGASQPAAPAGLERAAVVRRHHRLLGRRRADHDDRQHPGLEPAFGLGVERQA